MKKLIKLGLIVLGASALTFTMASAKCGNTPTDKPAMKCQAGKCAGDKKVEKCQSGKCSGDKKKMKKETKGKCGQGKCGSK